MKNKEIFCKVCESAYIETSQKDAEYVCTMCVDNLEGSRELTNNVEWELVTDCGNK